MTARARAAAQDGFTIVEVMAGIMITVLGIGAVLATLAQSNRASLGVQRNAQALSIAQREIEKIRSYPYASIAMSQAPSNASSGIPADEPAQYQHNPVNPDYWTSGTALTVKDNYNDDASATLTTEPIVTAAGVGRVDPVTTGVAAGSTTATVYRFVSDRAERCLLGSCSSGESRRVVVAVLLNGADTRGGPRRPVYVSTVVDRPDPPLQLGNLSLTLSLSASGSATFQ